LIPLAEYRVHSRKHLSRWAKSNVYMPAKLKCIISDPQTGKSEALELEGEKARPLLGLKIGDIIDGSAIGLSGQLILKGGSDKSGFPMVKGVHGAVKANLLMGKSQKVRRRATVRGEIVSEDIYQLNLARVVPREAGGEGKQKEEGALAAKAQEEGAGETEEKG